MIPRSNSHAATRTRSEPATTPGTSQGVRTVCGQASCTVGGAASAPVAATRSIQRPFSVGQVSVTRPVPVACATHMSEPAGSGGGVAAAVGPGVPAAAAPALAGEAVGLATGELLDEAEGLLVGIGVGVAVARTCQLDSPVTRVTGLDPTQPLTSVSRPTATTTAPDPGTLAVTVTG